MADEELKVRIITDASEGIANLVPFGQYLAALGPTGIVAAAGLAVALAGITALGAGLGFSIAQASEAEQVMAQLNAVIQSTGGVAGVSADMAQEYATALEAISGVSDETIIKGEALLLTFTNIGHKLFPEVTKTALDLSTAFGLNMSQASIMLGKALQDPATGLLALRRIGVSFSDGLRDQIVRMQQHGQVAQAQALILREVGKQVSGSAAAMGATAGGEWNKLTNIVSNFGEQVGGFFLPLIGTGLRAINVILTDLVRGAQPALRELGRAFKDLEKSLNTPEMKDAIKQLAAVLGADVALVLPSLIKQAAQGVRDFARVWKSEGPDIVASITKIANAAETVVNAINSLAGGFRILQSITGGAIKLPGFATGVEGFGGGFAMVGERGPEPMFIPPGSSVFPSFSSNTGGASGGGGDIHIHGDVNVTQEKGATLTDLLRKQNFNRFT